MSKFLDENGLLYFWSKIKAAFVVKESGKGLSTNDYTTAEKNKLSGIEANANNYSLPTASGSTKGGIKVGSGLEITSEGVLNSTYGGTADNVAWSGVTGKPTTVSGYGITDVTAGAEPNQNAFSKVVVGSTTIDSDSKTDTLTFVAGSNVTLTPDATTDKITIAATNTTYNDATTSAHGLMTANDKTKLNGISAGADVSPITSIKVNGAAQTITSKAVDITVPTVISDLTNDSGYLTTHQDISGKADKATTLSGYGITDAKISAGVITLGSNTITPVTDISGKVDKVTGKGLSTNDYTTTEKTKLSGISTGADVSPITSIKVNGTAQTITSKAVNITVPTTVSALTNDSGYLTTHQDISGKANVATTLSGYGITDAYTKTQIDAKITSTYKAGGSLAFASLPALNAANVGYVYNVTNEFTTTSSFVEGSGKLYQAGTNVAIVDVGSGSYKYDVMSGFIDLSIYAKSADITTVSNSEIDTIVAS